MRALTCSVALCTYHGERYLQEQLESIAAQSVTPDELVVGDDLSQDATLDILDAFAARAPFPVRVEVSAGRLGPTQNFAATMRRCQSDLVLLCDQDDVWPSDRLERLTAPLRASDAVSVVFSDASLVDGALDPLGRTLWEQLGFDAQARDSMSRGEVEAWLLRKTIAFGATMAYRRDLHDVVMPIPQPWGHDNWLALVAASCGEVALVDAPLLAYRQHGAQVSSAGTRATSSSVMAEDRLGLTPVASSYRALSERLRDHSGRLTPRGGALARAALEKAAHMDARDIVRAHPLSPTSLMCWLVEVGSGRYASYSNAWRSALLDLATWLGAMREGAWRSA